MVVMAAPAYDERLKPAFGSSLILIDPLRPDHSERGIVKYLKTIDAEKSAKNALLVLGTLALGLLLFSSADHR